MRCSVCRFSQVAEVDTLLASGASIRKVAQLYGLSRSTLARHTAHVEVTGSRFSMIRGQGGPPGTADPVEEALLLAGRARTPRERVRGLEQVRRATKLALRGVAADQEGLELLDRNIRDAEGAYRDASDFETMVRALSGWREALRARLDSVRPGTIDVPIEVTAGGNPLPLPGGDPGPGVFRLTSQQYFDGVPRKLHDPDRFQVQRRIQVQLDGESTQELRVFEASTQALVWRGER
jgi:transposase